MNGLLHISSALFRLSRRLCTGAPVLAVLAAALIGSTGSAQAQAPYFANICTGLGVSLPTIARMSNILTGLLGGVIDGPVNLLTGQVNANVVDVLSGQRIGLTVLDAQGNVVSLPAGGCNVSADRFQSDAATGITLGGGGIAGLGGGSSLQASAGALDAIAIGNGASTTSSAGNGVAFGYRAAVSGLGGLALGSDANVSSAGGVALGSGSVASRAGLAGATEAFSGAAVSSTNGAVSLGAPGAERQIVNVAGGTSDTDAANLRQVRAVATRLSASLGAGAAFDPVTGAYTAPSFQLRGVQHGTVASALGAVDSALSGHDLAIAATADAFAAFQANLEAGRVGLVRRDTVAGKVTIASGTNEAVLDIAGSAGARRLTGVAPGVGTQDAVSVGQLNSVVAGLAPGVPLVSSDNPNGLAAPSAVGAGSVAVGHGSVATDPGTFAVGSVGGERRLVNVAAGTLSSGSTDAVTGAQLVGSAQGILSVIGGGSSYAGGSGLVSPSFTIQGGTYSTVGAALLAVDAAFSAVDAALAAVSSGGSGTPGASADFSVRATGRAAGGFAPAASGLGSVASGFNALASGLSSSAVGESSRASGQASSSFGADSAATAARSTAIGSGSRATSSGASAVGESSLASAEMSAAFGASAQATFAGATAIGAGARAVADPTTAVGFQALASGNEASSFGAFAAATADNATALGRSSAASGRNSTAAGVGSAASGEGALALGQRAAAGGTDTVAVGRAASATEANSVAIGAGVTTSRANQVAMGAAGSTYTLAGIGSAASAAAQSGPTRFVTTDAGGNLAVSPYGPDSLDQLSTEVSGLARGMDSLTRAGVAARREARSGIASAMAMSTAPMPSAAGRTSWAMNAAAFQGEWATGFAVAHRLDVLVPVAITGGYSYGDAAGHGVRVGLAGEF